MTGNKYGLWAGTAMLMALLVACGGDSGSDGAGQSASGTDLKQPKAEQADGNAQAAGNATDAAASAAVPAPAARAGENEAAADQAGNARTDLGVGDNGIRGEKLANLLIGNNTYLIDEDELQPEAKPVLFTNPGRELSGPPPQGHIMLAPTAPDVVAYQFMNRGYDKPSSIFVGSQTFDEPDIYSRFVGGYEPLYSDMNIQIDQKDIAWSNGAARFKGDGDFPDGKLLLTLDRKATVSTQFYPLPAHYDNPDKRQMELTSDRTYEIKVGQVVPYETVLQRWADAEGNFTELFVQRGHTEDEIRICTNTDIKTVRRLTCNVWGLGGDDRGTYVVDDRSMHKKGAGLAYWRSLYEGTLLPWPLGIGMKAQADAPMSAAGVSGDVLAAMLTQRVSRGSETDDTVPVPLQRAEAPFPTDRLLADAPALTGYQKVSTTEQVLIRNNNPKSYEHSVQADDTKSFRSLRVNLGFSHEAGVMEGTEASMDIRRIWILSGPFVFDKTANDIRQGTELLNFGFNARIEAQGMDDAKNGTRMLHPDHLFSVHKGELFAYDKPLQRWSSTEGSIEMLVKKGANDSQASLCLKIELPFVKRTECSNWQLPSADWKLGTPLTPLGLSVTDDRSVYPGESGERFWLTPPDALKPAAKDAGAAQPQAAAQ